MKKLPIVGVTLIGSTMLCAVPFSLHVSQEAVVSVAVDTAEAWVGRPGTPASVPVLLARRAALDVDSRKLLTQMCWHAAALATFMGGVMPPVLNET